MTLKVILGALLDVIFPSFEVQKPGTGDRDVYYTCGNKKPGRSGKGRQGGTGWVMMGGMGCTWGVKARA